VPRVCTLCSHPQSEEINRALRNGTSNRAIAGQYRVTPSSVDRHRRHIGEGYVRLEQRRREKLDAELKADFGDEDLVTQAKALNRDFRTALEEAKRTKSLSAFLQIGDRIQRQLVVQSQLLERAQTIDAGQSRYVIRWQDAQSAPCERCGFIRTDAAAAAPVKVLLPAVATEG